MTQLTDTKPDLLTEIRRVLEQSQEPLTLPKLRSRLPAAFRSLSGEELTEVLQRQVAANVLWQYPKYRSSQDRFWDRPMDVHVSMLLSGSLEAGPLPWSELRRKLPAYAQSHALLALEKQIAHGRLHRHPRTGRGGERYGVRPADPKDYLRDELQQVFRRLEALGFTQPQLREAAYGLLHEEEWSPAPEAAPAAPPPTPAAHEQTPAPQRAVPPAPAASGSQS